MKFFSLREGKGSFGGWVCSNGLCQLLIILGVAIELGVKVEPANVGIRERRTTGWELYTRPLFFWELNVNITMK